jgi:hypothetical protein
MHYTQVFSEEEIAELDKADTRSTLTNNMPDQPEKPQTPSCEDVERELGFEKMSFVSEMLRPDAEERRRGRGRSTNCGDNPGLESRAYTGRTAGSD